MHPWYVAAGPVMVSRFLLMPPWTTAKVVSGVAPLVFPTAVGIAVCRAGGRAEGGDHGDESGE